ncbi:MAG: hypothetical protein BGO25_10330 [Acidobacteriales bacterium 59-55]|nr:MAG: hypothetical protein BGO25_10330 [Acidobacteriales bacterium 59-55]
MIERKLVREDLWLASGKIPIVFARNAIHTMVDRMCGAAFENNLQYGLEICDTSEPSYGSDERADPGSLLAMFELQTAGFVVIGEALNALNEEEQFLGAAFYIVLTDALRSWMPVYDHRTAEWYNEQLGDMMADDDPENRESYEFPDVEKAVPPEVKEVDGWPLFAARRLLRKHLRGEFAGWIERLFRIVCLSRLHKDMASVENNYDAAAVPSLLIAFRENDAIHACWDEEAAHYYESSYEPTCTVRFRPEYPEEFDTALRTAFLFLKVNMELAQLVNLLNNWEEKHASRHQHRTEPALRAA